MIVIIFICLQLIVHYFVVNIARLPDLVVHYLHHNHNRPTDFSRFIADHYANQHQQTQGEHDDLPFHDHMIVINYQIMAILIDANFFTSNKVNQFQIDSVKIDCARNFSTLNIALSIWRPPKII